MKKKLTKEEEKQIIKRIEKDLEELAKTKGTKINKQKKQIDKDTYLFLGMLFFITVMYITLTITLS